MLKKLFGNKQFRFWLVGALNFSWGLGSYPLFYLLLSPMGWNYIQILIFSYVVNTLVSFFGQKYLVFKTNGNHLRELAKFSGLQIGIFAINVFVLPLIIGFTGLNPMIAQTIFALGLFVVSFFFHDRITFSRKGN